MPILAWLYVGFWILVGALGFYDARREGKPLWYCLASVASAAIILYYLVAFWNLEWAERFGRRGALVLVAALCWEAFELGEDFRDLRRKDLPPRFLMFLFVLFVPAYVLAFMAAAYGFHHA